MNELQEQASLKNEDVKNHHDIWKPILLLSVVVAVLIAGFAFGFDKILGNIQGWIQSLGIWGPFGFMLVYIGVVVAALPGTILGVIAGAIFGSVIGVILVSISSTIASSITFLIARYFARDAVARWLSRHEKFRLIDELTEKQGALIVGIARLIPLFPFNLLNYGFGLTKVRFRVYVFWSWLCMLPGTIVVVVGADVIAQSVRKGTIPWILLGIVSVFIVILLFATWYLRKKVGKMK